jgi:hypothetical protein
MLTNEIILARNFAGIFREWLPEAGAFRINKNIFHLFLHAVTCLVIAA